MDERRLRRLLGRLRRGQASVAEAVSALREALARDPTDAQARRSLHRLGGTPPP